MGFGLEVGITACRRSPSESTIFELPLPSRLRLFRSIWLDKFTVFCNTWRRLRPESDREGIAFIAFFLKKRSREQPSQEIY
ncbi:MAG: hypothetical protein SAJ12_22990 [Jaaginema sp. PMC 1079.18]|nr:hypothetical protein [Jaaginema sp. PMC 1080.18]MEC4853857.1 hypothetical protein [Jaaginema sp. PMC 1079.18]MEC4865500.1 hypothetical protein [Jaaginema sp. PMC 1078.18]